MILTDAIDKLAGLYQALESPGKVSLKSSPITMTRNAVAKPPYVYGLSDQPKVR